jgi:hypothetical protein
MDSAPDGGPTGGEEISRSELREVIRHGKEKSHAQINRFTDWNLLIS